MKPLPQNTALLRQAATALLECYREPLTQACQGMLLILANKYGSATLEEAGRAVRLPNALRAQVFAATQSLLIGRGLIRPVRSAELSGLADPETPDTRFEVVDRQSAFRWVTSGFQPRITPPAAPSGPGRGPVTSLTGPW